MADLEDPFAPRPCWCTPADLSRGVHRHRCPAGGPTWLVIRASWGTNASETRPPGTKSEETR